MRRIWTCKIGGDVSLPSNGADFPMRMAIEEAYRKLTGKDSEFNFSGWGGELTESEEDAVKHIKKEVDL
jgi:hypothetical protein